MAHEQHLNSTLINIPCSGKKTALQLYVHEIKIKRLP